MIANKLNYQLSQVQKLQERGVERFIGFVHDTNTCPHPLSQVATFQ